MASSKSSSKKFEGNTKLQISPAIRWCFTLNNYTEEEKEYIDQVCKESSRYYIMGFEVGEQGTPHIQGYIEFKSKKRPKSVFNNDRIHWELAKGTKNDNFNYCTKDENYIINGVKSKPLNIIKNLYPWQKKIYDMVCEEPDDRTIMWIHEPDGNKGKSALIKYIAHKKNALVKCGKGNDAKNSILEWHNRKGTYPEIILIDLPRSYNSDHLNYPCIEEIKNGCFYSGKYEGGMCLFNSPHVVIMSNEEPDYEQLSKDRWKVIDISTME